MQTLKIDLKSAKTTLAKAIARAKVEKPLVRKTVEPGMYRVLSKAGKAWYHVYCAPTGVITCTCPARKPCKHCVAADNYHRFLIQVQPSQPIVSAPEQAASISVSCPEPVVEVADQPEESQSIAQSVREVACDRCETRFEPTQWEIDFVELEGGYYFCGPCTHWQIQQREANAVYFSVGTGELQPQGGPSHATL